MHRKKAIGKQVIWGCLFFAVTCGFGYAPLVRYDPRTTGLRDTSRYYAMTRFDYADVRPEWRYRPLVPTLAGAIAHWLPDRIGNWDSVFVSLLVVNGTCCALIGLIIMYLARRFELGPCIEVLAPFLYLSSYVVVNVYAAGMVDSSEALIYGLTICSVVQGRYWQLPILMLVGGLAKQTSVPLSSCFAFFWWLQGRSLSQPNWKHLAWIAVGSFVGLLTISLTKTVIGGDSHERWAFSLELLKRVPKDLMLTLKASRSFVYSFAYLVPLAIFGYRWLPSRFLVASSAATMLMFCLGVYGGIGTNINRPLFNAAGYALALSAAITLVRCGLEEVDETAASNPKSS